jgi:hypothetical protein
MNKLSKVVAAGALMSGSLVGCGGEKSEDAQLPGPKFPSITCAEVSYEVRWGVGTKQKFPFDSQTLPKLAGFAIEFANEGNKATAMLIDPANTTPAANVDMVDNGRGRGWNVIVDGQVVANPIMNGLNPTVANLYTNCPK